MIDWTARKLDVFIWDVGHGLSITIITPFVQAASGVSFNRRRIIQYDAGINNEFKFFPISYLVEKHGLRIIDCLILSHPDKDHIDELHYILDHVTSGNLDVISLIRNTSIPNTTISEVAAEEVKAKTAYKTFNNSYQHSLPIHNRIHPANFAGVEVQTEHLYHTETFQEPNNLSVVASIKFGTTQIFIPGDLEEEGTDLLIDIARMPNPDMSKYRILLAPHHGSRLAKPARLLKHVKPHIVLASAEKDHEHTDSIFSSPEYVIGHPVVGSNGVKGLSRFSATKGETIHIETYGEFPTIRRIPYEKDPEQLIKKTLSSLFDN